MRTASAVLTAMLILPASAGDRTKHKVEYATTQTIAFDGGGKIRIDDSFGELRVEGWNRPDVELTVKRATNRRYKPEDEWKARERLRDVRVEVTRSGADLLIRTHFPDRGVTRLFRGKTDLDLEYTIRVPARADLSVRHSIGEVVVRNVHGDMSVTNGIGEVSLRLPREKDYQIEARAKIGDVSSDFDGRSRRRSLLGAEFRRTQGAGAGHVYARVGIGEIRIDRMD
ncbi:MAG: hypothetical protein ACRD44_02060 [Bryobacteraceae bacterium]